MYQDVKVTQIDTRCETSSSCSPMPRGDSHSLRKGVLRCYTVCRDQDPTNAWILWIFFEFFGFFRIFYVFSCIFPMQKPLQKPLQIWIRLDQSMAWKLVAQVSQVARIARVALSLPSPAWPGSLQLWPHLISSSKLVFHLISSYDPITILSQLSDTCWDSQRLKGQECKARIKQVKECALSK